MSGTTQRMFIINATTPGGLTFSGVGTATFNNAIGTSNQFNVGSNTSIGVNASVSATQEFDGLSLGVMQPTRWRQKLLSVNLTQQVGKPPRQPPS